jgi:hypothetical protein
MSYKILANCAVGLGFSAAGFEEGLRRKPDLVGCDAGSADFGPGYLGLGTDAKPRSSAAKDLSRMIEGAVRVGAPFVTGSCGGPGARPHVDSFLEIARETAQSMGRKLRVAVVYADQDPAVLHQALDEDRIRSLGAFQPLTHEAIDASASIVAMMGTGPLMQALDAGADVVLAGRCADPAILACGPLRAGIPAPIAWHAAKTIDKGYLATTRPREGSPVIATLDDEGFTVEPTKESEACSIHSVAQVTLHENPDPFRIIQPSGTLYVEHAKYEQIDDRRVRITGSGWEPAKRPSVKLEGARQIGYRTVMIAGLRDPRLLSRLDEFLDDYRGIVARIVKSLGVGSDDWKMTFRPYGRNAIMVDTEPMMDAIPHEVGLVVDVVAKTQDLANTIISRAGPAGSRYDFTGRLGGGGNFAYPFSPNRLSLGPVFEWSVWHVMDVDDECAAFRVELVEV